MRLSLSARRGTGSVSREGRVSSLRLGTELEGVGHGTVSPSNRDGTDFLALTYVALVGEAADLTSGLLAPRPGEQGLD